MNDVYEGFEYGIDPENEFHLHQVYEKPGSVKQVICAKCGQKELEVGCGSYYTVIRCPKCGHESCIHDG